MGFGVRNKKNMKEAVQRICVLSEVQLRCNITPLLGLMSTVMSLILIHENTHPSLIDQLNALVDAGSHHALSTPS